MQWNLRSVMADRDLFQTSDLLPLLTERGIHLSREHVYRLVTKSPQRINVDVLAALCDALACTPADLMTPIVEHGRAVKTGTSGDARESGPKVGTLRPIRAAIRRPGNVE